MHSVCTITNENTQTEVRTSYVVEQNCGMLHSNKLHFAIHQNIVVLRVLNLSDDGSGESNRVAYCCKAFFLCVRIYTILYFNYSKHNVMNSNKKTLIFFFTTYHSRFPYGHP